jgi:hypothetical protein
MVVSNSSEVQYSVHYRCDRSLRSLPVEDFGMAVMLACFCDRPLDHLSRM